MTDKEKLECCERIERSANEIDRLCKKLLGQLSTPPEIAQEHIDFILEGGVDDVISYKQGIRDCVEENVYQYDRVNKGDSSYDIGYSNQYQIEQILNHQSTAHEETPNKYKEYK